MNRCDWRECFARGLFDGVAAALLNAEGRKNIALDENRSRFIYLCSKHFALGVGELKQNEENGNNIVSR
jgi:hypothetical protein